MKFIISRKQIDPSYYSKKILQSPNGSKYYLDHRTGEFYNCFEMNDDETRLVGCVSDELTLDSIKLHLIQYRYTIKETSYDPRKDEGSIKQKYYPKESG